MLYTWRNTSEKNNAVTVMVYDTPVRADAAAPRFLNIVPTMVL